MVDSVGGTQTYGYDGLNRQTRITPPGAAAVTVTYDAAGNVATYTDPAGKVTYGYDAGNELISLAEPGGSCTGTVSKCTTFGYNGNGARTRITFPGNTTQTTTLDVSGRPTEIKAVHGTTVLSDLTYTYKKGSRHHPRANQGRQTRRRRPRELHHHLRVRHPQPPDSGDGEDPHRDHERVLGLRLRQERQPHVQHRRPRRGEPSRV